MDAAKRDFYQRLRADVSEWLESKAGKRSRYGEYLLFAPDLFHLLCKLVVDPDVPRDQKLLLGFAVMYFVSPIDLLPEGLIGPIGYLDDIALAAYVLDELVNETGPATVRKHWAGSQDVLKVIRRIVANVDDLVGEGLWERLLSLFKNATGFAERATERGRAIVEGGRPVRTRKAPARRKKAPSKRKRAKKKAAKKKTGTRKAAAKKKTTKAGGRKQAATKKATRKKAAKKPAS